MTSYPDKPSYTISSTSIGTLIVVGSPRGISRIHWVESESAARDWTGRHIPHAHEMPGFFTSSLGAIERYLNDGVPLDLPYNLIGGTALQRVVWLAIAKIAYAETISYTALAERVGFPRAVRAVASACGANPIPLLIPCHRVISKDGSLGGFSLNGIALKEKLLTLEKNTYNKRLAASVTQTLNNPAAA